VAIKQKRCLTLAVVYAFFAAKKVLIVSEGVGLDTKNTRIDTIGQVNVIIIEKMVRNQGDKCNPASQKYRHGSQFYFHEKLKLEQ
jgi:hypothetical protein